MGIIALCRALRGAGVTAFALMFSSGGALAGTVYTNCDCTPNTTAGGCPAPYCTCVSGQGLGALDTNEYRRNCKNANAGYPVDPYYWCTGSFPSAMVGSLPENMTCTTPEPVGDYYFNDCTNWNLSSKHFNVYTYCTK